MNRFITFLFSFLFCRTFALLFISMVLVLAAPCSQSAVAQTILRVDRINGSTTGDGSDWGADAFLYLRDAIVEASVATELNPYEIWVAAGTYKPDEYTTGFPCPGGGERCKSFEMHEHVRWYGGFAGNETGPNAFNLRAPLTNITILSGDIGTANDPDDNSYHVVTAFRVGDSDSARIDGFHIIHGNATDAPAPETGVSPGGGGGMLIIGR